jgi:hypothetical protein
MADFYLIGNLEADDDLYIVNTTDRSVCPVPREVWEDVVGMFAGEDGAAAEMIADVESARASGQPLRMALSANNLGDILVTVRIEAVERAMEQNPILDAALRPHLVYDRAA